MFSKAFGANIKQHIARAAVISQRGSKRAYANLLASNKTALRRSNQKKLLIASCPRVISSIRSLSTDASAKVCNDVFLTIAD